MDWNTDHNLLTDHDWLSNRFKLFETYTLPSVLNQSCKNFKYILAIDKKTPKFIVDKFEELNLFHKIFYSDGFFTFTYLDSGARKLAEFIENDSNKEYIISSALDTDDSIHKDYIKIIQDSFDHQNDFRLIFSAGYSYHTLMKLLMYKDYINSQYINFIEKRKSPLKTCYYCGHTKMEEQNFDYKIIDTPRLWVDNIHNLNDSEKFNINNQLNLVPRAIRLSILSEFTYRNL